MVRVTCAVSSRRRRKKIISKAKGYWGDRKNHVRLSKDAVTRAMINNYEHRKQKKRSFRCLWIVRISAAAKIHGLSYSKLIHGLKLANCDLDRKVLAELAFTDPKGFGTIVEKAKAALV